MTEKVVISGSRSIDPDTAFRYITELTNQLTSMYKHPDSYKILVGDAAGVDRVAKDFAIQISVDFEEYKAEWNKYGTSAGPIRNTEMAEDGDMLIAIWNGESSGTEDMINCALKEGLDIHVKVVE